MKLSEEQGCYLLITNEDCMDHTIKTIDDIFNWLKVKGKEESLRMVGQEIKCLYCPEKDAFTSCTASLSAHHSRETAPMIPRPVNAWKASNAQNDTRRWLPGRRVNMHGLPPRHPVQTCQDDNRR